MIKNKSGVSVKVQYDGISFNIAPGATFSAIEAFGVAKQEGLNQEARFVQKHADKLVVCGDIAANTVNEPKIEAPEKEEVLPPAPFPDTIPDEEKKEVPPPTNAESLAGYSKKELMEMAANLGLTLSAKLSKDQIIIELDQKMKEHESGG